MKVKITYILANIDKAIAFEWIANELDTEKFELSFIHLHSKEPYLHQWLLNRGIKTYYIPHKGKRSYLISFLRLLFLLIRNRPKVIHSHLFDANILGLSAAKLLGIKKRIYTRHHATYHHQYFPNAVKWDRWSNFLATHIVAVSENVKEVLINKEGVFPQKVKLIHHGFDLKGFKEVSEERIQDVRVKYNLNKQDYPIVGLISRYMKLKGIQYIVPVFNRLLKDYPNAKLIMANAHGPDKEYVRSILDRELEPGQYIEIGFEQDLFALYKLFDIFIHVPINEHIEAFGQIYVEALAAGIPSVFTLSGVAKEFIINERNALVVDFENEDQLYQSMIRLITDKELRAHLIKNGFQDIQSFSLKQFIGKLEELYLLN